MTTLTSNLFLTDAERAGLRTQHDGIATDVRWMLQRRAERRATNPGLMSAEATVEWWHVSYEFIVDAAMTQALHPDAQVAGWLRGVIMDIVQRCDDEWAGPAFRSHGDGPAVGHLETAHLSWAVSIALDCCEDVFSAAELALIRSVLRERAIPMCRRWLDGNRHLANWRCILLAGATTAAAVLGEQEELARCAADWRVCAEAFQEDGSYGESLQYSHYAMYALMLAYEAIHRAAPELAATLPVERYGRGMRWHASSLLYRKALGGGWGEHARARSINFNDSGTIFAPSPELLLHIALRCRGSLPDEAALARWILDEYWLPVCDVAPHDRAGFGFIPDWTGFALPFLGQFDQLPAARSPQELGLKPLQCFDCGDTIMRDSWNGSTVVGIRGGGDDLHCHGHLHADLNSLVVSYGTERLLIDPGHSCYRGLIHGIETSTGNHSTCSFIAENVADDMDDRVRQRQVLQHTNIPKRALIDGRPGPCIDRGARRFLAASAGTVSVVGNECAAAYDKAIDRFERYCILAGSHCLFVIDHISAPQPVRTCWNWVLNNRGDQLDLKRLGDRLVARRGNAGMKLFHLGGGSSRSTMWATHAWAHEAYHPLPNQLGEGPSGSAVIVGFQAREAVTECWCIHAIALDSIGAIAGWHLRSDEQHETVLESPDTGRRWSLALDRQRSVISVSETVSGQRWHIGDKRLEQLS